MMNNKKASIMLSALILWGNLHAIQPAPQPAQRPAHAPSAPSSPDFNSFLFAVATGVTITLVSKACDYMMSSKEVREQEIKLQLERSEQQRMLLTYELCKEVQDEETKKACVEVKKQFIASQLAMNSKR